MASFTGADCYIYLRRPDMEEWIDLITGAIKSVEVTVPEATLPLVIVSTQEPIASALTLTLEIDWRKRARGLLWLKTKRYHQPMWKPQRGAVAMARVARLAMYAAIRPFLRSGIRVRCMVRIEHGV